MKLILLLILTATSLFAQIQTSNHDSLLVRSSEFSNQALQPLGWLNDFDSLFIDSETQQLETLIKNLNTSYDLQIAIVTLNESHCNSEDFDSFTLKLANDWGVGKVNKNNGILFAISQAHRKTRIHIGLGLEKWITDEETAEVILQTCIPYFKNGNYFAATQSGLLKLCEQMPKNK